ncbi:hypothetical protein LTR85_012120 [Meristemomyces frigidus]|nr:hypothetical protein LTR85_012120 [Meristemomyces frigidus]
MCSGKASRRGSTLLVYEVEVDVEVGVSVDTETTVTVESSASAVEILDVEVTDVEVTDVEVTDVEVTDVEVMNVAVVDAVLLTMPVKDAAKDVDVAPELGDVADAVLEATAAAETALELDELDSEARRVLEEVESALRVEEDDVDETLAVAVAVVESRNVSAYPVVSPGKVKVLTETSAEEALFTPVEPVPKITELDRAISLTDDDELDVLAALVALGVLTMVTETVVSSAGCAPEDSVIV